MSKEQRPLYGTAGAPLDLASARKLARENAIAFLQTIIHVLEVDENADVALCAALAVRDRDDLNGFHFIGPTHILQIMAGDLYDATHQLPNHLHPGNSERIQ